MSNVTDLVDRGKRPARCPRGNQAIRAKHDEESRITAPAPKGQIPQPEPRAEYASLDY